MKRTLSLRLLSFLLLFATPSLFAQNKLPELSPASGTLEVLTGIQKDKDISADSTFKILNHWNKYPTLKRTGINYAFYYNDEKFGRVPMRVWVPATYSNAVASPCVISLHGAVGLSKFTDIDSTKEEDEDILLTPMKQQGYIIVQPLADRAAHFTWASYRQNYGEPAQWNPTYETLARIIIELKRVLNIIDNKVYAFGHSDGADGAIGLGIYKPDQFAAVVAYNAMFNNLFTHDYFLRNMQNTSLYEVHSDKDALRPIKTNRQIIDSVKKFGGKVFYKEYAGYEHYDRHLSLDEPNADSFMKATSRDPFKHKLYLEVVEGSPYNTCDWLTVTMADTTQAPAAWHKPFDFKRYYDDERLKKRIEFNYFSPFKSAAVKASYDNNVFTLQTSGVTEAEIKISPQMVNLKKPVTVVVNGKQVFKGNIAADKTYIINNFQHNADRYALWVNSVKVKLN